MAAAPQRAKGFILVLVVDEKQADGHDAIARVCRDYDVTTLEQLQADLFKASRQAGNQLRLRDAMRAVVARAG